MKSKAVITPQIREALAQVEEMVSAAAASSIWDQRLGVVCGPAGSGKTRVSQLIERAYPAARSVRLDALITTRSLLDLIFQAVCGWGLGMRETRTVYERTIEELRERENTILLIDEADNLLRGDRFNMLDVVRDLADKTGTLIVLFSVKKLAARLRTGAYDTETFSSRLFFQMEFHRPSIEDAALFAKELLEGVTLDRDLVEGCWQKARGSYRPLMRMYAEIERVAREADARRLNLAKWRELAGISGVRVPIERAKAEAAGVSVVKPMREAG